MSNTLLLADMSQTDKCRFRYVLETGAVNGCLLKSKDGLKFLLDRKTGQKQVLGVGNHIPTRKNKSVTQSSGSSDQDMPEMQLENGRYVAFT